MSNLCCTNCDDIVYYTLLEGKEKKAKDNSIKYYSSFQGMLLNFTCDVCNVIAYALCMESFPVARW